MKRTRLYLIAAAMALLALPVQAGTWTALANNAPGGVQLMMLLTDGTVACSDGDGGANGGDWYRLTPTSGGGYINGTWSAMASMNDTRRFQSSQVLRSGKILMAGGEYGTGFNTAEIYNPVNNTWTLTPAPGVTDFVDSPSMMLPDGRVLVYPLTHGTITRGTKIYNPVSNTWINGPATLRSQVEASWVKLPDDSILTVDVNSTQSERYIPALNAWINDDAVTVALFGNATGNGSEIGPALLLPDGRAFFIGANGNTAFYTPSGTTNNGSWATGPDLPNSQGCPDAPGAVMIDGKVLFTCSPIGSGSGSANVFTTPTSYYEYDPVANTYTRQNSPYGGLTLNNPCYTTCMLVLPTGFILYSDQSSQLYVYQPTGAAIAAAKPDIHDVGWLANGTLRLTGTKFNGLNAGAGYGDDLQMDSNYPLVRFISGGSVYYGKTYDWSDTGVATGSKVVSTESTIPTTVLHNSPNTAFSMYVVVNGVASDPVTFRGPVWVDFNYGGAPFELGTFSFPYNTLAEGVSAVATGGTIAIKPGSRYEPITITKAMKIVAVGGSVTIGN